jgi:hypothetical protein
MELNFDTFFGLEETLNANREILLFWPFLGVFLIIMLLTFIFYIFRKLNINRYIIEALMWSLLITFITGIITIIILYLITDISGVKLAYVWLSIFIGYLFFTLLYNNTLKKLYNDYSKTLKKSK